MSYASWPESLPEYFLVDYTASGTSPILRQQMESGMDRTTRISSTIVSTNTYSMIMNEAELVEFWAFYRKEANAGASLVWMPMITDGTKCPHLCRFVNYPTQVPDGMEFKVTFTLETDQQNTDWSKI